MYIYTNESNPTLTLIGPKLFFYLVWFFFGLRGGVFGGGVLRSPKIERRINSVI